jgi:integrase
MPGARGPRSRPFLNNAYTRVWRKARQAAFSTAQQASPLARVPYHLRHAAVSLRLNAGVPAPQVAEWAGHSVHVLMKVYAKCVDGQEEAARYRVEAALGLVEGQFASPSRTTRSAAPDEPRREYDAISEIEGA